MHARAVLLALVVPVAASAAPAPAPSPCNATVHGELTHVERKEQVTRHTFTVSVTTLEPCATIHFTLSTTEKISKTKVKVFKTKGEVRLREGSIDRVLEYDMPNDHEMVKWDVKVSGCERCAP